MPGKVRKYCAPRRIAYPLQFLDLFVDLYARGRTPSGLETYDTTRPDSPSILLMTAGHLGDALVLSYTFPLIRQRYPNAQIDILAGSWCDPVWRHNPYVRRVIHLNHASTNRSSLSRMEKWQAFFGSTRSAIKSLADTVYDYSVDIRYSDSPMHFILPFLKVKRRIGFGSRGMGGLLDDEFFLPDQETNNFDLLLMLLKPMGVEGELRTVKPYFFHPVQSPHQLWSKLGQRVPESKTILICPESGSPVRMLSVDYWCQLATRLLQESPYGLVFSGQREFTTALYERVRQENPTATERLYSVVGQLTLEDLISLSEQALAAFTLDSLPMHLCCLGCPTVSFQKNGMGIQFFPIGSHPTLVIHNHDQSRMLKLDRPESTSDYVTVFDDTVLDRAMQWFRMIEKQSQAKVE
ncbi:glycosyltransferase family 9 protein [Spirosoma radiotolerans]|uniref:ADP-heptose--LPS heptosyltransferase n=1 Tax=Spirosoma radiotolerans TaxID=1379870 RepID=A0A0E3V8C0_9BACT|nr:glycosyltransferase family 9 protein [Spirosoma radiotolerans]AKD56171.1 ADP-heptose--LPS heptosyltransferase [Spirosoma radiotolerans]